MCIQLRAPVTGGVVTLQCPGHLPWYQSLFPHVAPSPSLDLISYTQLPDLGRTLALSLRHSLSTQPHGMPQRLRGLHAGPGSWLAVLRGLWAAPPCCCRY